MERFDERLCNLKLRPAIKRLHEEAGKCWGRAMAEVKEHGNRARFLPAFIACQLQALASHLGEIDRVYREVWLWGGNAITPRFIQAVLMPRIFLTIAARKGAIGGELDLYAGRTGKHISHFQRHLALEISGLQGEIAARYEAEAIEVGKQIAQTNRALSTPSPPKVSTAPIPRQETPKREKIGFRQPDRFTCEDPEVAKRRAIARQNKDLPADRLCGLFDESKVPLPLKWKQEFGVASWVAAYKNKKLRLRIQPMISKDRRSR